MRLVIDSCIFVASLRKTEPRHKEAVAIVNAVASGKHFAFEPYLVLVEVVAAIRRRTGSEELARRVKQRLLSAEHMGFVEIDAPMAEAAADLAMTTRLRGMDALVIQTAIECSAQLVTFDEEIIELAQGYVSLPVPSTLV